MGSMVRPVVARRLRRLLGLRLGLRPEVVIRPRVGREGRGEGEEERCFFP